MSGVGSTNAMKKGSGNNPFLAYSEADMQGFLNSACTGRIVKYAGPSTKTAVPRGQKLSLGDAQNLVVDLTKNFTYSSVSYKSREWNIGIEIENSDNTKTNQCIMNIKIDSKTGIIGSGDNDIQALIYSEYTPYSSLYGKNINEISVKFLAVTSVNVDRDVVVNWPITYGKNGWQSDCFNDLGKITLWGYGETVLAYQNQNNIDYWGHGDVIYTEPYIINELYKVVYGDGQYYFEEFYYISENVTTATVEDVAPGKTFYDFTGTKQTGTGTKINPYIASTADEMAAYLTSSYKGAFIKYIGETVTVGGTPAPVNPIAVGDILQSTAAGDEGRPILYLNTNITPDFSQFPDEQMQNGEGYPLILAVENVTTNTPLVFAIKIQEGSDIAYTITDIGGQILYAHSDTMLPSVVGLDSWGWQTTSSVTISGWGGETKVAAVNQQDVWGAYISKDGQWTSSGGESYVKNAIYQVAEDGDTTRYAILPTLNNPADPIDVAEGKEVINQFGVVMIGTGNVVLRAATTEGMQALFTTENIGKVVQYVGETDVYIKDAFYLITVDASAKQYYELPELTNEGTASDLTPGKQLINSKGEIVVGSEETTGDYTVKVIDYDGTVLLEKKGNTGDVIDLPTAPTHEKLVFQEWSASVAVSDNKVTIADNDIMVGAVYTTASGQNEFDITLTKVTGLSVTLNMSGTKDWGDGTSDTAKTHTYTAYGNYTIKCNGMNMTTGSDTGLFGQSSGAYNYYCTKARFATVTNINKNSIQNCYSLTSVVISNSVTNIANYVFRGCYSLESVVIPNGVEIINEGVFSGCYSLINVVIPNSVTNIADYAFYQCYSLASVVISNSVTNISNNAFNNCYTLTNFVIPNSVTHIYNSALSYCYSLTSIGIPSSVNDIDNYAFYNCYSITKYDFSQHTSVPTLSGTNAFTGINKIAKIIVPDSLYDTWIAASNWSTYADYIYKASEVAE